MRPEWIEYPERSEPTKECEGCGEEFPRPKNIRGKAWENRRFCSYSCSNRMRGSKNPNWKGGLYESRGYTVVNHPERGKVFEHRLVMEGRIGRRLLPTETVHHINGVKTDNRTENLQLRHHNHGAGQAFRCTECGSGLVEPVALAAKTMRAL